MSNNNEVVLITGALAGIGRATALAFARDKYRVVISGRREEAGKQLLAELEKLGAEAAFIRADVRFENEVENLVNETVKRFGRLDIAVNNAGTEGSPGPVQAITPELYAETFDTNVLGVVLSVKHEIRAMLPNKSGSIVNITSAFGKVGAAYATLYVASKHAVEGVTKSVAREVGKEGIRVNAVAPGPVETEMLNRFTGNDASAKDYLAGEGALGRVGTSEEIADAIVFVASKKAAFVTGQSFSVDGGRLA
jgi:NAD(P)-dependent dehydrogenase (short-subunit alcohol dehydrogenase family)